MDLNSQPSRIREDTLLQGQWVKARGGQRSVGRQTEKKKGKGVGLRLGTLNVEAFIEITKEFELCVQRDQMEREQSV